MIFVLIARSCDDCGQFGIQLLEHEPTIEDKEEITDRLGGMYCIRTTVMEVEKIGDIVLMKD
jgi:hypothetical protein